METNDFIVFIKQTMAQQAENTTAIGMLTGKIEQLIKENQQERGDYRNIINGMVEAVKGLHQELKIQIGISEKLITSLDIERKEYKEIEKLRIVHEQELERKEQEMTLLIKSKRTDLWSKIALALVSAGGLIYIIFEKVLGKI